MNRYYAFLICFLFNTVASMEIWAPCPPQAEKKKVKKTCGQQLKSLRGLDPENFDDCERGGLSKITLQREYLLRKSKKNVRSVIDLFLKAYDWRLYDEIIDVFIPLFERYKKFLENEIKDEKLMNEIENKIKKCKEEENKMRVWYNNYQKYNYKKVKNPIVEKKEENFLDSEIRKVINVCMEEWKENRVNRE